MNKRENLEEGRKMKQKNEHEKGKLESIKQSKLNELMALGIDPKYTADLEKFKIK